MLRHSFVIRYSTFVLFLLFVTGIANAFAEKRTITEKDLWDFVWIGDPQVSPDGSRVAFVRVTVNEKRKAITRPFGPCRSQAAKRRAN